MKLTETEKQAIKNGEPVQFQEGDMHCVVLRADLCQRFQGLFSECLPPEVVTALVDDAMADYDSGDPLLGSSQKYKR